MTFVFKCLEEVHSQGIDGGLEQQSAVRLTGDPPMMWCVESLWTPLLSTTSL